MTNSQAWNSSNMVLAADDSQLTTLFHFLQQKLKHLLPILLSLTFMYIYFIEMLEQCLMISIAMGYNFLIKNNGERYLQ